MGLLSHRKTSNPARHLFFHSECRYRWCWSSQSHLVRGDQNQSVPQSVPSPLLQRKFVQIILPPTCLSHHPPSSQKLSSPHLRTQRWRVWEEAFFFLRRCGLRRRVIDVEDGGGGGRLIKMSPPPLVVAWPLAMILFSAASNPAVYRRSRMPQFKLTQFLEKNILGKCARKE